MSLQISGITMSMVANEIGHFNNNLGVLCNSQNINKWSKYKPIINDVSVNSVNGFLPYASGLIIKHDTLTTGTSLNYFVPCNTTNILNLETMAGHTYDDIKEFFEFRLGDFRKYNHNALKPSYDAIFPDMEVFPGENQKVNLVFTMENDSLEIIKSILSKRNYFDEISYIDSYFFGNQRYNYNQLTGLTSLSNTIYSYSVNINQAVFPFQTPGTQYINYSTPYFTDSNNDTLRLYLDKSDALENGDKFYTFNRNLVVPELFNKYAADGTRKYARFRDVPLMPIVTGIPSNDLVVKSLRLYCQSTEDQGVPAHYTIHLNADGDFRGNFVIQVKFDVYAIDWNNKIIGSIAGQTDYTVSGYESNAESPDVPSSIPITPYLIDGTYGNNDVYIHLTDPLQITNILLLDNNNSSIANYNLVDNRIKHFAIKPYIDFVPA